GRIGALERYEVRNGKPFFQEFVVRCPAPVREINDYLVEEWGIIGGYDLGRSYRGMENQMLVCVTEVNRREEIDALVDALAEAGKEVAA
ncbi:MAG TPA: glycine dehydrogenase, partial [Anaerolineae bacterium]|nr:glycine dehydrogenase [Anaerolineae bacterium]